MRRTRLRRASFVLFVVSAFAFGASVYLCMFCIGARVHIDVPLRALAVTGALAIATCTMGLVLSRRAKAPVIDWITPRHRRWP